MTGIHITGLKMRCAGRRVSATIQSPTSKNPAANYKHRKQVHRCVQYNNMNMTILYVYE